MSNSRSGFLVPLVLITTFLTKQSSLWISQAFQPFLVGSIQMRGCTAKHSVLCEVKTEVGSEIDEIPNGRLDFERINPDEKSRR